MERSYNDNCPNYPCACAISFFFLQALNSRLDVLRQPTDTLILRFFSELAQCQSDVIEKGKADLGTLLISVGYHKGKSLVEVDIIQGKNLPGLDKTGWSTYAT